MKEKKSVQSPSFDQEKIHMHNYINCIGTILIDIGDGYTIKNQHQVSHTL